MVWDTSGLVRESEHDQPLGQPPIGKRVALYRQLRITYGLPMIRGG
jgi:hypothetical protein